MLKHRGQRDRSVTVEFDEPTVADDRSPTADVPTAHNPTASIPADGKICLGQLHELAGLVVEIWKFSRPK
ncbi:MAG: hypothetical protein R3C53_09975 [Pirellulaceae bacterium]